MRAEPFTLREAARIVSHPDTPASYVEWRELLPLTGENDRTHLGNLLGWSFIEAALPLGASRRVFERAFPKLDDDRMDEWMSALAETPARDFVDHHVPFVRNVAEMSEGAIGTLIDRYLAHYQGPRDGSERRLPGRRLMRPRPEVVHIEVTRSCNFACTMCSSRTGGFLPSRTMSLPMFGDVVRVLGAGARVLRINGYGETTLIPGLEAYLDCLEEFAFNGLREIITNLSGRDAVYRELVARGFVIVVSWDATNAALFERIRVGASYVEMSERLRKLGRWVSNEPERLVILSTVQEQNRAEIPALVRLAADVGAGLVIFNMVKESDGSPWMRERYEELRDLFMEAESVGDQRGVSVRIPDHIGAERLSLRHVSRSSARFCDRPWIELLIRWDGEATVCNMFNPFSYGMLMPRGPPQDLDSRVDRLWEGPNARLFREIINTRASHPYCTDCYFLRG